MPKQSATMTNLGESPSEFRFREAIALHREMRFEEAVKAYQEVLQHDPRHAQSLTFLAVIAFQANQFDRAADLAGAALELDPNNAAAHLIQGHSFARLNQLQAAMISYERVIAIDPHIADAHRYRADILDRLGCHLAALASYDRALELTPTDAEIHNNRANALGGLQRYDEAIAAYDRAIALAPHLAGPHYSRGVTQHGMKCFVAALQSYDRAININPLYAEAYYGRANVLRDMRRLHAALSSYDQALEMNSGYAEAHMNRGIVLGELERFEDALASCESAISLAPENADAHYNRGNLLYGLQRDSDALQDFDRALSIDRDHAQAHFGRSLACLALGDLENGWREFEWRWKEPCVTSGEKRNFQQPLWLGKEPLDGRTILVHCEQGLGDTIQFCRYVPLLTGRGPTGVIFEVPASLYDLLCRSLGGVSQWVRRGERLPYFDCYCPLLSLPLAFGTTLNTIPSGVPYLKADPRRLEHWRDRLRGRTALRVGLVWSGGARPDLSDMQSLNDRRNIPLAQLAALELPDIEFYSLQKGQPAEGELARFLASRRRGPAIFDHTRELNDFSETAALIEQLDLIISVDTATVHLAGALGKPVWMMDRFDGCWRWLRDRRDTPWYASVRIYRQRRRGDWEAVVQELRRDLQIVADRHAEFRA